MDAGFAHQLGRSEYRLRCQAGSHIARQAHHHAAVSESLDDHINVRRPAATQPGDDIHLIFFDDFYFAHGLKNAHRHFFVDFLREFAQTKSGSSFIHHGGNVGHHPNDRILFADELADRLRGDTGKD